MEYNNFKLRFYNDVLSIYPNAELDNNTIIIVCEYLEISISLHDAYSTFEMLGEYNVTLMKFLKNIEHYKNEHKFKINYDCIYPTIRSKTFGKGEKFPFFRYDFFLDLDVLYIQDMGEMFRFLSEDDVAQDEDKIKQMAIGNLEKTLNPLVQIEKGVDVYTYKYLTDFNSTRILLDSEINRVKKILGNSFLVAIPNTTNIFFSKDNASYQGLIENLIKIDPGEYKISTNIYRYNNGLWTCVNSEKPFKVI